MRQITQNQYCWLQNANPPKGHHHDSTRYHQIAHMQFVPSDSNRKHLCFPPVALLLVQLPWWRFHPKGCSPSPGRDASLAPGRPWTPLNGFQNGPDFWGGTAVQRNYEFGTHFKYCQSEVKQKKLWTTTGGSPQIFIKVMPPQWFKKATSRQIPKTASFFFLVQKLPKTSTLFRHLLMHLLTPFASMGIPSILETPFSSWYIWEIKINSKMFIECFLLNFMVAMILAMHFFESTILVFRKHPGPTTLNFRGLGKSWLGTQGDTNQIQLMFTDLPWLGPRDGFWTKQTHGGSGLVIGRLLKSRTNFTWTYQLSRSVGSEFLGFFLVARGVLLRKTRRMQFECRGCAN